MITLELSERQEEEEEEQITKRTLVIIIIDESQCDEETERRHILFLRRLSLLRRLPFSVHFSSIACRVEPS